VDDGIPFAEVADGLRAFLATTRLRLKESSLTLALGRRSFNSRESLEICRILREEYKIKVDGIALSEELVEGALAKELRLPVTIGRKEGRRRLREASNGDGTLLVRHPCRTGTVIRHSGTVIVVGNVNPGAEIIAGGDIFVLGTLGGIAHAGAYGNTAAVIVALSLKALQLRIAHCIGVEPPSRGRSSPHIPEMAYLVGELIVVEPYTGFLPSLEEFQTHTET
jgi:septum site-determining protein MinC